MFFTMCPEPELINEVYYFTKIITTLDPVFKFAEYLPDFVFNRICTCSVRLELSEVWK